MFDQNEILTAIANQFDSKFTKIIAFIQDWQNYILTFKNIRYNTNNLLVPYGVSHLDYIFNEVKDIIRNSFKHLWKPTIKDQYLSKMKTCINHLQSYTNHYFIPNSTVYEAINNIDDNFIINIAASYDIFSDYLDKKTTPSHLNAMINLPPFRQIFDFLKSIIIFPYWKKVARHRFW